MVISVYNDGAKTDYSGRNYRGITLLSAGYKVSSKVILLDLTQYMGDIDCNLLRSSDGVKYMGVRWDSASAVCRLQSSFDSAGRCVL
jgi:hypothetical protein